jgi:lysophospholipase L1-like esterase
MRIALRLALAAGALVVVVAAPPASASSYLNLAQATAGMKASLAAGGQADIVLLGDSLSYGPDTAPFGDDAPALGSYRPAFTRDLQRVYGNAGAGFVGFAESRPSFGAGWTAGVINPSDPSPHSGLDGQWLTDPGPRPAPAGGTLIAFADRFELHYVAQPGGGRLNLTRGTDGARIATLPIRSATKQVRTFTYQFPTPDYYSAVRFQPIGSGPVTLLGWNRTNDNPGVRVHRGANGGWSVSQYLQRDWTFDQELQRLNTDLVVIATGINEAAKTTDEYTNQLGRLIDRIHAAVPDSGIVLVSPYDFGGSDVPRISGAMEQVAAARQVGFINLYELGGPRAFYQQNGYLSDGIHFTDAGGEYVGGILARAIENNGAAAAALPEPTAAALALGATALLLRRRRAK